MELSSSFEDQLGRGKVCRQNKSQYGLKQSPRAQFEKFAQSMKSLEYTQGQTNHTMFYKHSCNGKIIILIVYVDDLILTGSDEGEILRLKKALAQSFEIKDQGNLQYFLSIEVQLGQEKGIVSSQRKYVLDLLKEHVRMQTYSHLNRCKHQDEYSYRW